MGRLLSMDQKLAPLLTSLEDAGIDQEKWTEHLLFFATEYTFEYNLQAFLI